MSTKIKSIVVIIAILLVLFLVKDNNQSQTFKIGGMLPLTGDFGSLGEEINRGAIIAVEELKSQGLDLEYIPQDDQSTPIGAVNAANHLLRNEQVDAAITAIVQEVKPVASLYNDANVPLLTTWDSNEYLKTAGSQIFTIGFSTENAGQKMARFAYEELKLKTIATINHNDEWSELITDAFQAESQAQGGKIVMREKINTSETDYRTLIVQAKKLSPDGLWFPMIPPVKGPFMIQAKQLSLNSVLLTGDGLLAEEIEDAGLSAENVYYANIFADSAGALASKYKTKFGSDPYDPVFVSFGYDGIHVLAEAYKISRKNNVSLTSALKNVDMKGVGSRFNFNGTQYSDREEKIYKIVKGRLQLVKK